MDHPQEDLAKFGSSSETKVDFFLKLCYTLAKDKELCSKYGKFQFFFSPQNMATLCLPPLNNPLDKVAAPFVLSPKTKTLPSILSK